MNVQHQRTRCGPLVISTHTWRVSAANTEPRPTSSRRLSPTCGRLIAMHTGSKRPQQARQPSSPGSRQPFPHCRQRLRPPGRPPRQREGPNLSSRHVRHPNPQLPREPLVSRSLQRSLSMVCSFCSVLVQTLKRRMSKEFQALYLRSCRIGTDTVSSLPSKRFDLTYERRERSVGTVVFMLGLRSERRYFVACSQFGKLLGRSGIGHRHGERVVVVQVQNVRYRAALLALNLRRGPQQHTLLHSGIRPSGSAASIPRPEPNPHSRLQSLPPGSRASTPRTESP